MQPALGEAGGMAEQAGHGVAPAGGVFEAFAQNHVAAALAVHRPRLREVAQAVSKFSRRRERFGMQLRIAARQPAAVGTLGRRLVGERRERQNLGAGAPPRRGDVRIDEAERAVAGERDALARRRQGHIGDRRSGDVQRRGDAHDRVEIKMLFGGLGEAIDEQCQIGMFAGLHQAEMALGQSECGLASQRAEDGNIERSDGVRDQRAMPFAADAVQDHAGDAHARVVRREAANQRGRRLRLPRHVDDEDDRQGKLRGEVGGGAAAAGRRRGAVEQAHDALDHQRVGAGGGVHGEAVEERRRHRPAVEIDARRAGHRGMKRRIDVIRPGLGRAHGDAAALERGEQRQRHRGLAGAGLRRGDDKPTRGHAATSGLLRFARDDEL